jgi:hypothetical protein
MSTSSDARNPVEVRVETFLDRRHRGGAGPALPISGEWRVDRDDCAPTGA